MQSVMNNHSYDDSFRDCRNFLVQLLYVFPSLRYDVFVILYGVIRGQGEQLATVLSSLRTSLEKRDVESESGAGPSESAPLTSELSSLKLLSPKQNSPKRMLRSLNTVSFVRTQLTEMNKRRRTGASADDEFLGRAAEEKEEQLLLALLDDLNELWVSLSVCLDYISKSEDTRAVMSLQYVAEAFFLAHALTINGTVQDAERSAGGDSPPTGNAEQAPAVSHLYNIAYV